VRARHDLRTVPVLRPPGGHRADPRIRLMESHASISPDVLARYAADAALEVDGVHSLVSSHLPRHRPVRITVGDDGRVSVELHLAAEWGAPFGSVGPEVQAR